MVGSLVPRNKAREVAMRRETEGKRKRKRKSVCTQRESRCTRREREKTKMSGLYSEEPLGEKKPRKVQGRGQGVSAMPCNR